MEGLINVSLLSRIENGERPLYKTMRNRLLGRLGVTPDMYENLLNNEDYITWKWHHHILYAIEQKDFQKAVQLIQDYEKQEPLDDKTKQQFCVVMCAEVLRLQGADNAKLASLYERAVYLTVPQVEQIYNDDVPEKLLSVLEVNTILEYEYYKKSKEKNFVKKCKYWIAYVEESFFDRLSKVKIYPKIVWYYLREMLSVDSELDLLELEDALQYCEQAIELLRDTKRAYYLVELLAYKQKVLTDIIEKLIKMDRLQKVEAYKTLLQESIEMEQLLKNLYTAYHVSEYMQDCTYLYRQRWVFAIGDVLRIRRNMLGLTQEQVCDGICSVKSLRRAEKKQVNMQQEPLEQILRRLGVSKEIQKTALVTNDKSVLYLKNELSIYRNNRETDKARVLLRQLRDKICLEIPENMQFVMECEASLDWMEGMITKEEFAAKEEEALRYTLKADSFYDAEEVYLTETEMSCICKKMQLVDTIEKRESIAFLLHFFEKFEKENLLSEYIAMYEFVMANVTNELSSMGEYQLAIALDKKVLGEVLRCRRLCIINEFLYDILWSDMQQKLTARQQVEKEKMTNDLRQCIIISHFCKRTFYERFYQSKIY
ncbi:MAG: helix-turn-helix transcriptional regulator [Lachnospiraceae bacterium]|nr:helix-turn-helix transcriptional regulator [Lachnospiraceae bacterium]